MYFLEVSEILEVNPVDLYCQYQSNNACNMVYYAKMAYYATILRWPNILR